ncbi:MAG TPA: hypothetical protein VIW68_06630 [Candidatus Sulfotelmatobacter sp.]
MTTPDERMEQLLKQSLRPTITHPGTTPQRDLWPAMLHRLDQTSNRIPWFDWALLAAVVMWLAIFPRAIPVLLYHL